MPPHAEYVEPFLGGGEVMRCKLPARENVGLDLDARVVGRAAELEARGEWRRLGLGDPGLMGGSYRFACGDAIAYLRGRRWQPTSLVYLDPPYLLETRRGHRRMYRHEFGASGHRQLLEWATGTEAVVLLSGYRSEMYDQALSGWRVMEYWTMTRQGPERESLWSNRPEPGELHDYRFVGEGYRERERIRKLQGRWLARLRAMPRLEGLALLAALRACGPERISCPRSDDLGEFPPGVTDSASVRGTGRGARPGRRFLEGRALQDRAQV
jgi:hypothetical protein